MPASCRDRIGGDGSHLERYAKMFNAVEIDTSFYRPHRVSTYLKWARMTPDGFRFTVKVPKAVTHEDIFDPADIDRFTQETAGLGEKLALVLVQFPPSKVFDKGNVERLFDALKAASIPLVCEPRHASWFNAGVDEWLADQKVSRVAAHPSPSDRARAPGGWPGLRYFRLHGAPRIYYSSYDADFLDGLRDRLAEMPGDVETWYIFDNTALGAATENALDLRDRIPAARAK